MKNRAKCKQCETIIESFHATHLVFCNCGKIGVDGGDAMKCIAENWDDFIRVDDEGNEVIVQVAENTTDVKPLYNPSKPSKEELLEILDEMIKSYENLPDHAMNSPINHYDMLSVLLLVSSILRS